MAGWLGGWVRERGPRRYLGHVDELGENLGPELSGGPAQHHQLDPLGDAVAQCDGALHHRDVLHAAVANVILIVCKLRNKGGGILMGWGRGLKGVRDHFPLGSSFMGYSQIFCRRT